MRLFFQAVRRCVNVRQGLFLSQIDSVLILMPLRLLCRLQNNASSVVSVIVRNMYHSHRKCLGEKDQVDLQEFSEILWEKNKKIPQTHLMQIFEKLKQKHYS